MEIPIVPLIRGKFGWVGSDNCQFKVLAKIGGPCVVNF